MDNLNIQMLKKKFIAIILARGGSKGIKNKNLYKIKKPLYIGLLKIAFYQKILTKLG